MLESVVQLRIIGILMILEDRISGLILTASDGTWKSRGVVTSEVFRYLPDHFSPGYLNDYRLEMAEPARLAGKLNRI